MGMKVAEEIRAQLGHKAECMLGAYQFVGDEKSLTFKIKGSPKKVNCVQIELDAGTDTYVVKFYKVRKFDWDVIAEETMVYVDALHRVIEANTGLYTAL